MDLTLYGTRRSRGFRVLWMLEELGVPYAHDPCAPRSEAVRAVSPSGKIPVLVADGAVIPDSSAILTFLADSHGRFAAPAGAPDRARQDGWLFRVLDEVETPLWTASKHSFILPEDERVPAVKPTLKAEYARAIDAIFRDLTTECLGGDEPCVADFVLVHCGGWAQIAGFPEPSAPFAAYLDRLRARPAFGRAAALP